jgi:putative addiction module CopG family antidote
MRTTQALSVTLPHEMARMLKDKVASGEYATESEVIRAGLRALQAQEQAVERWLRDEVARSVDEVSASPDRVIPVEDVLVRIKTKKLKPRV